MEWIIIIALAIFVYVALDINAREKEKVKYKNAFDPDYPYYAARELWITKIEIEVAEKGFDEKDAIYEEYWKKNKQELLKVKKNADHSKEFKDIMYNYHYYRDNLNDKVDYFHQMIETNYAIRNGNKTYAQINEDLRKSFLKIKKSGYDKWLEHESK